jgi:hypothetical protein
LRKAIAALALVFLAAHVSCLPPSLEDIDSINFALGVAHFDVTAHQPHPPGYPVFIALGKASTAALRSAHVKSPESAGLAIWSAISGAALAFGLFALFNAFGSLGPRLVRPRAAFWATVMVMLSPLFWFTALRPLSDTTGLAAAIAAQALIALVIAGQASPSALVWGGLVAGLAVGIRSQTFLLTLPLFSVALLMPRSGLRTGNRVAAILAAAIGVLAWAIPLIVVSGGVSEYVKALGSQAGEDFSGVVMLWTTRTKAAALDAAMYSFLWPWGHPIAGVIVMLAAFVGFVRSLWAMPRALALVLVAYVPYAVFHLLFQETITVRYALPLVVPVGYLAMCGLDWGRGMVAAGATLLAAWSFVVSAPATIAYGDQSSPAFRALLEAARPGVGAGNEMRVVGMHAVARRAADWLQSSEARGTADAPRFAPKRVLKAPHGQEWLTLVSEWRADPSSHIFFVADPRRTDLALIDPTSRRHPLQFRWGFVEPPFVGGTRPGDSDLYAMMPPGWMLDRGWALTAEVAGVTARDGFGPHLKPSVAWIRSRPHEATLAIGGRHLGAANDPPVQVTLALNGKSLESFDVKPGFFSRRIPLRAGLLVGSGYLPLEVSSRAANGPPIAVGLEQFDVQSPGTPMIAADDGWYEPEFNPRTAQTWRWTAEKATLWVRPIGRDVRLTLAGESPLKYFDQAPTVVVTVGSREVARFNPTSDFTREIVLPADALTSSNGQVVVASDKFFVPAERQISPDPRHLALRMYSYSVR